MRALCKAGPGPGLEMVEIPEPEPGPGQVKLRVLRTGLCGTDVHIYRWDGWAQRAIKPPLVPGHEFCGEVVAVGEGVSTVHVGDFASGEGHQVCGLCRNCRAGRRHLCIRTVGLGVDIDGAFAEYVVIPETNVWVHRGLGPADLDPDLAGIFDPLGNAVHTALAFPLVGEDVLITGAGPIGLMATAIVRKVGARLVVVTDVNDERLALARTLGADLTVNVRRDSVADAQRQLGMAEGFDVALEMSGAPTALPEIIANLNHGGRVAVLGLPSESIIVDWTTVVTHMITIRGIYGREMFETWYAMSALLRSGLDVSPVITDRFAAADWEAGFAAAADGNRGKVVLDWTEAR
jgi:threonine 3-dehydrogenase